MAHAKHTASDPCTGVEDQFRFETLLAEISAHFVRLPADRVDGAIEEAQALLCEKLGLDRSALWQWSREEPDLLLLTHLYQATDRLPVQKPAEVHANAVGEWILQPRDASPFYVRIDGKSPFPWMMGRIRQGETIVLASLDELPEEAALDRENLQRYGTKSTVAVPFSLGGAILGYLTFASTEEGKSWPEALVKRFRFVADLFTNALARKQADLTLHESEERYRVTSMSYQ
jgi:formate hydrogenlyase transcriptional activator